MNLIHLYQNNDITNIIIRIRTSIRILILIGKLPMRRRRVPAAAAAASRHHSHDDSGGRAPRAHSLLLHVYPDGADVPQSAESEDDIPLSTPTSSS